MQPVCAECAVKLVYHWQLDARQMCASSLPTAELGIAFGERIKTGCVCWLQVECLTTAMHKSCSLRCIVIGAMSNAQLPSWLQCGLGSVSTMGWWLLWYSCPSEEAPTLSLVTVVSAGRMPHCRHVGSFWRAVRGKLVPVVEKLPECVLKCVRTHDFVWHRKPFSIQKCTVLWDFACTVSKLLRGG